MTAQEKVDESNEITVQARDVDVAAMVAEDGTYELTPELALALRKKIIRKNPKYK
ncbi:hypothetical protein CC1G_09272 [Coprinopsis cinerea okayama7|uniref:Uncharacterized protein n=1 Tax=Coprinopsis cinerea (strain Okayama-7 / 130 / ATCC MYA-4618 / FGSC 9003) TaxID=240176 RepID=A8N851_COPC7|nr:hypothetical protein CC1G_09272 [Coprinopsis cinerea okayama7\|eukprot:XP_001831007.1 hypothetical protein CC1G_09272 [Coprinopsis cinerea okayama7\